MTVRTEYATDPPLTTQQAANYLGVSVRTLDRYVDAGKIRPFRLPSGHRRFRLADLEQLLGMGGAA